MEKESDASTRGKETPIGNGSVKGGGKPAVKVKPNEPCPCDSGKKFKKCCGAN